MTLQAIIPTGLTEHIYNIIPSGSIRSLDATNKRNFSALKSTQPFTLTPVVARARRWKQKNPLKRQITSIRARGVTSSFLIVMSFYRLTVGTDVIAAPDHVRRRRRHTHTHTHTHTLGRTPLDEGSTGRRDLQLTKHNTHNRQTSMPRRDSKPHSQRASGRTSAP